ncbi:MAG TPA: hypothetical protein VLA12_20900 [Planctomycetaceae bacterium]|nr:hypothetical protein [Planctomycetaceae bacterium]
MCADWFREERELAITLQHARPVRGARFLETKRLRNCLLGEVALADEQWNNENPRRRDAGKDVGSERFLFPERDFDLLKHSALPQRGSMLIRGFRRFRILSRSMTQDDQRPVGKIVVHSRSCLPQVGLNRKSSWTLPLAADLNPPMVTL